MKRLADAMERAYVVRDGDGSVVARVSGGEALDMSARHVAAVKAVAVPDWRCGPEMPVAPARGGLRTFTPFEVMPGSAANDGDPLLRRTGYRGRTGAAVRDAFDEMADQTRRASRDAPAPFTSTQVQMGRDYAALVERCAASGVRGSSGEVLAVRAGGSGGDWIEAVIRDHDRLRGLRARVGEGWAIEPRRVSPHADRPRRAFRAMEVVDLVCVGGLTLDAVLARFGWSRSTAHRGVVRAALCAALDRMMGYRDGRPQDMG